MLRWITFLCLAVLLAACSGTPPLATPQSPPSTRPPAAIHPSPTHLPMNPTSPDVENPFGPRPGDAVLGRGGVFIDSQKLRVVPGTPPQGQLSLQGNLPDPCHELRALVHAPDEQNLIRVEVYSVFDPVKMCAQVLRPFEATTPLGTIQAGQKYTVEINGKSAGVLEITP